MKQRISFRRLLAFSCRKLGHWLADILWIADLNSQYVLLLTKRRDLELDQDSVSKCRICNSCLIEAQVQVRELMQQFVSSRKKQSSCRQISHYSMDYFIEQSISLIPVYISTHGSMGQTLHTHTLTCTYAHTQSSIIFSKAHCLVSWYLMRPLFHNIFIYQKLSSESR